MIDRIAPASTRFCPACGSRLSAIPSPARINANSPICARLVAIVSAVRCEWPNMRTSRSAATDLPKIIIARVPSTASGCSSRIIGSNSIPTETKNSTANASRSGRVSCAARWLSSDSFSTIPAKKAPSAKETSNSSTAPKAIPSASARTERVKSSREPVAALRAIIHGTRRRPTTIIIAMNATTLPIVMPISSDSDARPTLPFSSIPATAGSRTSVNTITRSSTISQPIAICPR